MHEIAYQDKISFVPPLDRRHKKVLIVGPEDGTVKVYRKFLTSWLQIRDQNIEEVSTMADCQWFLFENELLNAPQFNVIILAPDLPNKQIQELFWAESINESGVPIVVLLKPGNLLYKQNLKERDNTYVLVDPLNPDNFQASCKVMNEVLDH